MTNYAMYRNILIFCIILTVVSVTAVL